MATPKGTFADFRPFGSIAKSHIDRYTPIVPADTVDMWARGEGTFFGGYYKLVDPERFTPLIREACPTLKGGVVLFATAMADLLLYHSGYMRLLDFRHLSLTLASPPFAAFVASMTAEPFLEDFMAWQPYPQAVVRLGPAHFGECFAYSPLLCLNGEEIPENLGPADLPSHLRTVLSFSGPIGIRPKP